MSVQSEWTVNADEAGVILAEHRLHRGDWEGSCVETVSGPSDLQEPCVSWQVAHTVATEVDRTRATVVASTRRWAGWLRDVHGLPEIATTMESRADAIENGAAW